MSEFPTVWHLRRYYDDLKRELEGAERRIAELTHLDADATVVAEAKAAKDNVAAEIKRIEPDVKKAEIDAAAVEATVETEVAKDAKKA